MVKISPSILSADFASIEYELKILEDSGADMLHIDVMDGHFVPNLTFGSVFISKIRKLTNLKFDVHLMIDNPEINIDQYIDSGADVITIHPSTILHLDRLLRKIRKSNVKSGIALLPNEDVSGLKYILDLVDVFLVMTVNPGFAGQDFITSQLDKIKELKSMVDGLNCAISVDGGINEKTAKYCRDAGADMLVSGSYIFNNPCYVNGMKSYSKVIDSLR